MRTVQEFQYRITVDDAFCEIAERLFAQKRFEGARNASKAIAQAAVELGYAATEEDVRYFLNP